MNTAHSQEFIESMKKALLIEKQQLEKELGVIAHTQGSGEYTANYPDYERDEEANAMEMADFDATNATTKATQARLNDVQGALEAIELGKYGLTKEGDVIPEERLKANPAATTIIKL